MQNENELKIWYDIVEHAKSKWNQDKLIELISSSPIEKQRSDQILFYILVALASGESPNCVQQNIYNELEFLNCPVCQKKLGSILKDVQKNLSDDIYATYLAFQMLEDGTPVSEVSDHIRKLYSLQ